MERWLLSLLMYFSRATTRVMIDPRRVLILGEENARIFALSGYLTGRGYQVDRARAVDEARALMRHLQYHALVTCVNLDRDVSASVELLAQTRLERTGVRTIALTASAGLTHTVPPWLSADVVIGSDAPVAQVGKTLCASLAE